jgi:hypothetical protein
LSTATGDGVQRISYRNRELIDNGEGATMRILNEFSLQGNPLLHKMDGARNKIAASIPMMAIINQQFHQGKS